MTSSRSLAFVLAGSGALMGSSFLFLPEASAEIRATDGRRGLSTEVNGRKGGRCKAGICRISGGTSSGRNKFHRFGRFDTRGKIRGVRFETGGKRNVVVGVTSPYGTYINKVVKLSSKANLYWLSPGGINLGRGAGFVNVPGLNLSTVKSLRFPGGVFHALHSSPADLRRLQNDPLRGASGFQAGSNVDQTGNESFTPGIRLEGIDISIDQDLLIDAPGGRVAVKDSRLSVSAEQGKAGTLTLSGDEIHVDGQSQLLAKGTDGGADFT